MGVFNGLMETAISPLKVVTKTTNKMLNEEWKDKDILSLGSTKVIDATKEEVKEINDKFEEDSA